MYTVKLMNEYLHGPIWVYNNYGVVVYNFPLIHDDDVLKTLSEQAATMYDSYFEFNSHDAPCRFNYEKEKQDRKKMLKIVKKIVERLNEINDGSFVVEDCINQVISE